MFTIEVKVSRERSYVGKVALDMIVYNMIVLRSVNYTIIESLLSPFLYLLLLLLSNALLLKCCRYR